MRADLEQIFDALADPARLGMIGLLRKRPLRSGELARQLALSRPVASKHLRVLRRAGLIEELALDEDARARAYQLRPAPFSEVRGWLNEVEEFWTGQLGAFKTYAERRASPAAKPRAGKPR